MHKYSIFLTLFVLTLSLFTLGACGLDTDIQQQTATHIARPAFMVERQIPTEVFTLNAWERMHDRGRPATIYIADGAPMALTNAPINKAIINSPTRRNPVALHLASRDQSDNLAFLAQPCQYVKTPSQKGCDARFWREDRFSPIVMDSFNNALQEMKARYDLTGFHLVGHGSGANVAAVLAATRNDVLSLRTVAGDLNPAYTIEYHQGLPLSSDAMLAPTYGTILSKIPQHHYIGAADRNITPGAYHSYRQALGLTECISYSIIQDANDELGWVQLWPQLLALKPSCGNMMSDGNDDMPITGNIPKPMPRTLPNFPGNYKK